MFSVRGAASPTPCYSYYNTHTQIMNNAHHKNGSAPLDDLCRVCGCKLHRGIKAKGRAVKPEPPYSCISYADKFLVAFNINILVDTPEIHSQMFCTLCLPCSCGKRAEESLQVLCSATHALGMQMVSFKYPSLYATSYGYSNRCIIHHKIEMITPRAWMSVHRWHWMSVHRGHRMGVHGGHWMGVCVRHRMCVHGGHWMGVHGGIGWVYIGTLDGCAWGHWMGVHRGHWMGVHRGHWMGVQGGHWMGVHGGIEWVYMGALDGCTSGAFDGCTSGALDRCTWGHWMCVHGGHWMGAHGGHWMGYMGGIGRVYMGALEGCTWGTLDGDHRVHGGHWMGGIGWCTWGALDGCAWGHWMGVYGGHWMGVHGGHWMGMHGDIGRAVSWENGPGCVFS